MNGEEMIRKLREMEEQEWKLYKIASECNKTNMAEYHRIRQGALKVLMDELEIESRPELENKTYRAWKVTFKDGSWTMVRIYKVDVSQQVCKDILKYRGHNLEEIKKMEEVQEEADK